MDKPTASPFIMSKWELDRMVEEGILAVDKVKEGWFPFRKKNILFIKWLLRVNIQIVIKRK